MIEAPFGITRKGHIRRTKNQFGPFPVKPLPSLDDLDNLFVYEPRTGKLRWRGSRGEVGSRNGATGYRSCYVNGKTFSTHRLIWKLVTGCDPVGLIDHINGCRDDNRIANLRVASHAVNARNRHQDHWATLKRRKMI